MNKIKYIIQILAVIIFWGCTEDEWTGSKGDIQVMAGFATTRTTFVEDNGTTHVTWNTGDAIGLFTDEQNNLQYTAVNAGSETQFSATGDKLKATEGKTVYACYPYSYSESSKKIQLPGIAFQKYKENASEQDFIYASGNVTNKKLSLQFKHLFAFLKIKISLSLLPKGENGYNLNIASNEKIGYGSPAYFDITKEDITSERPLKQIGYFIPDNNNLEDEKYVTCYIAILPQSQDAEITITTTTDTSFEGLLLRNAPSGGFKAGNVYTLYFDENEIEATKERERDALIALYNATNGDKWTNNENWCSDKPVSEWYGITCFGEFVDHISLRNNNLNGTLPDEIGNLTNMTFLFLPKLGEDKTPNNLQGEIPESIGELKNIKTLDLIQNSLSGLIPKSILKLTRLEVLALKGNELSGTIPEGFSHLTKLHELTLDQNNLSGSFPTDLPQLLDNENLIRIDFGYNCLTGKIAEEVIQHPRFPDFAGDLLRCQKEGYGFDMSNVRIPAMKRTYPLLDGNGTINLGEEYTKKDYTLLFRWAEWCPATKQIMPTITNLVKRYKNASFQIIGAYGGGNLSERMNFMQQYQITEWKHFKECEKDDVFDRATDHPIWINPLGYGIPFLEVVDRSGNIVFLEENPPLGFYSYLSITHRQDEIEDFLRSVLGEGEKPYESTDYSKDGNVTVLQKATEGNGIDVVLMGDAYSDRLIADGTYEATMRKAADFLFTEEPFKTYRNLFNVYMVDAVSKNEIYGGETALSTYFGDGTLVGGNNDKCFEYAQKAISDKRINEAMIVVMINSTRYAGTCYMYSASTTSDYGSGPSISYFPVGNDDMIFEQLLHHEADGHGFSKLADEYAYQDYGAIPTSKIEFYQNVTASYGWYKNVDFTSDPTQVKWSKYLSDSRYSNDGLGVFEGACTYWTGAYRPTDVSIMRYNTDGFNAPSREAIYYRIHKLAYGTPWIFNYEDFVAYDAKNRKASTRSVTWNSATVKHFRENHCPPVVIRKNWRNVK